jgi:hypothetical protein
VDRPGELAWEGDHGTACSARPIWRGGCCSQAGGSARQRQSVATRAGWGASSGLGHLERAGPGSACPTRPHAPSLLSRRQWLGRLRPASSPRAPRSVLWPGRHLGRLERTGATRADQGDSRATGRSSGAAVGDQVVQLGLAAGYLFSAGGAGAVLATAVLADYLARGGAGATAECTLRVHGAGWCTPGRHCLMACPRFDAGCGRQGPRARPAARLRAPRRRQRVWAQAASTPISTGCKHGPSASGGANSAETSGAKRWARAASTPSVGAARLAYTRGQTVWPKTWNESGLKWTRGHMVWPKNLEGSQACVHTGYMLLAEEPRRSPC